MRSGLKRPVARIVLLQNFVKVPEVDIGNRQPPGRRRRNALIDGLRPAGVFEIDFMPTGGPSRRAAKVPVGSHRHDRTIVPAHDQFHDDAAAGAGIAVIENQHILAAGFQPIGDGENRDVLPAIIAVPQPGRNAVDQQLGRIVGGEFHISVAQIGGYVDHPAQGEFTRRVRLFGTLRIRGGPDHAALKVVFENLMRSLSGNFTFHRGIGDVRRRQPTAHPGIVKQNPPDFDVAARVVGHVEPKRDHRIASGPAFRIDQIGLGKHQIMPRAVGGKACENKFVLIGESRHAFFQVIELAPAVRRDVPCPIADDHTMILRGVQVQMPHDNVTVFAEAVELQQLRRGLQLDTLRLFPLRERLRPRPGKFRAGKYGCRHQ
ncbi:hypothetical protein SDC9_113275 [bioreactor metagenome]|uniref:Uncharacterized protein n=1 Tax=bioreactor metagenome TaxID=1076179 RepID=A0A645BML7_9ZZZZ